MARAKPPVRAEPLDEARAPDRARPPPTADGSAPRDVAALPRRFDALMVRVGRFNYAWTNTESVLAEVLARLMGTPVRVASVVFLTLNTTRARIDLAERLVRLDRHEAELLDALRRFRRLSRLRNKLNHSVYDVDGAAGTLSTQATRVVEGPGGLEFGRVEPLGDEELARIDAALGEIRAVNEALWRFARPPSHQPSSTPSRPRTRPSSRPEAR